MARRPTETSAVGPVGGARGRGANLLEHESSLRANPRMGRSVLGLRHLDEKERRAVRRQARAYLDGLTGADR
jgi:hypothetical protein